MIQTIINILVTQLRAYIDQTATGVEDPSVVVGNIGLSQALGGMEDYMRNRLVISLVNIIEEATMKNASPYHRNRAQIELSNPPAFLNLYLLVTANFNSTQGGVTGEIVYNNSLTMLSHAIEFFQSKNVFSLQNSPNPGIIQDPNLQDIRFALDLHSMTFEQVNHLWGSLGGKQVPFVMYKARVLPVKRNLVTGRGGYVSDIQNNVSQLKE